MAHRVARGKKSKAVLAPGLHPHYAAATQTLASTLNIKIDERECRMGRDDHVINHIDDDTACVVVQSPNVFGEIVDLRPIAEKAHAHKALLIAVFTEPVALAAITPPGEQGADIVVGEGQGLGVGLAFGGPHVGLFACRKKLVRQMPGRVCGETVDANGERGFVLTLSTREQHIRREKATSNICTNSGLCCLAFTIHMSLLGDAGIQRLATLNHEKACDLADRLDGVEGAEVLNETFFNEFTLKLIMKTEGRPTTPEAVNMNERQTVSGSKGLNQAEKLIFEVGTPRRTGVDLPEPKGTKSRLGGHARKGEIGLPLTPKAGAHGELCGMMAIRARLDHDGASHKRRVLVPESAHGTNPATAVQCGFSVDEIPANAGGRVDMDALRAKHLVEDPDEKSFGRMCAFHGNMGMYTRALSYMMSHGSDGLKQATEDAVLNANYVQASLSDVMTTAFEGTCMHEALFDDRFLKDTGVETLDFAKAMIDEGYHPMTMYFPLVVHGAMLIEPTESESKGELDRFILSMRSLAIRAKQGDAQSFKQAPVYAPMRRLDETQAARKPILRWTPPADIAEAAE